MISEPIPAVPPATVFRNFRQAGISLPSRHGISRTTVLPPPSTSMWLSGLAPSLFDVGVTENPARSSTTFISFSRQDGEPDGCGNRELYDTSGRQLWRHAESGVPASEVYTVKWDLIGRWRSSSGYGHLCLSGQGFIGWQQLCLQDPETDHYKIENIII